MSEAAVTPVAAQPSLRTRIVRAANNTITAHHYQEELPALAG